MDRMKEKMQMLVELSNQSFHAFIAEAKTERPNIVKSALQDQVEQKGFKFHGNIEAFKVTRKSVDGTETESWRLRTTFTSNKGDLHWDVTSRAAIDKAVADLQNKVIPIRFEHQSDDYGVWDTFKTEEQGGILLGIAEGELYQTYNRTKDLWHDIYELGKEFATSYGGKWVEFHWYAQDNSGEILRVFDEIVIEEISLTTRPANPDTAMEVLNKFAGQLENTLEMGVVKDFIFKRKDNMEKDILKTSVETEEVKTTPVEQPTEEAPKATEEPQKETPTVPVKGEEGVEPTGESTEEPKAESKASEAEPTQPVVETPSEEAEKSKKESNDSDISKSVKTMVESVDSIVKAFGDFSKELDNINKRLEVVEGQPEKPVAIAKTDGGNPGEGELSAEEAELKKNFPLSYSIRKSSGLI